MNVVLYSKMGSAGRSMLAHLYDRPDMLSSAFSHKAKAKEVVISKVTPTDGYTPKREELITKAVEIYA